MDHYVTAMQWDRDDLMLACRCGILAIGERETICEWWQNHWEWWQNHRVDRDEVPSSR